jgi:CRP-like cAMP-binding protein
MDRSSRIADRTPDTNRLLSALGRKDRAPVLAECEPIKLTVREVLWEPGQRIRHVYFPLDGFVSQLVPVHGRDNLEVALVGNEGMLGISLVLGVKTSHFQTVVQGSGSALRIRAANFDRMLALVPALRLQLARYACVLQAQLAQTLACNHFHALDRRLADWLLSTQDRTGGNSFHLTQKLLGQLLGVRRVGITNAAGVFQKRRLIRYSRGHITILDRPGLEKAACGCYQIGKNSYQSVLG